VILFKYPPLHALWVMKNDGHVLMNKVLWRIVNGVFRVSELIIFFYTFKILWIKGFNKLQMRQSQEKSRLTCNTKWRPSLDKMDASYSRAFLTNCSEPLNMQRHEKRDKLIKSMNIDAEVPARILSDTSLNAMRRRWICKGEQDTVSYFTNCSVERSG
jgi:hypothetical protein